MGRHYVRRRNEPSLCEQRVRYYLGSRDADTIADLVSLLRRVRSLDVGDRLPRRLMHDIDRFMVQEVENVEPEELRKFLERRR